MVESEEQDDYSRLYYYDYESESQVYACSQANCNHDIGDFKSDKINCNAIIEGKAKYPFIYNRRLYYFVGVGDTYTLWSSKTDGTDKKEVNELGNFTTDIGAIDLAQYDIALHHPDIIYTQNPFDNENKAIGIEKKILLQTG